MYKATYDIKIESMPKNSNQVGHSTEEWTGVNLLAARGIIQEQRTHHDKNSKWYKIYSDRKIVFDSHFIKK